MLKPIICTSEHLRTTPKTRCVAEALFAALDKLGIEHMELKNTNDYWCRDYMPVILFNDGIYAKYKYRPDYLNDYKTKKKYITEQTDACKGLELNTPTDMYIVFDGGNYVRCGNKVLMTDKILMENPQWTLSDLFRHLKDALCADVILLPWDMQDKCGHADGMVTYLGDDKVLLNNCWKYTDKAFHNRLLKILHAHFDVIELSYKCKENKNSWCYLNYLQLPNAILLPCLSEKADCDNDQAAIESFNNLFPDLEIIPIYSKPLIDEGGALHCVTWEYIKHVERCVYPKENLRL